MQRRAEVSTTVEAPVELEAPTAAPQEAVAPPKKKQLTSRRTTVALELTVQNGRAVIPEGLESVPELAFASDPTITALTIPDTVVRIGRGAFQDCTGLTMLKLPPTVMRISEHAFDGCSALTEVVLPNGVTKVGDFAFRGCTSVRLLTIPPSVREIGWSAFESTAIAHLDIPPTVTKIGGFAFDRCPLLTTVGVPSSTEINETTFGATTRVRRLPPDRDLLEGTQFVAGFSGLGFRPRERALQDMSFRAPINEHGLSDYTPAPPHGTPIARGLGTVFYTPRG